MSAAQTRKLAVQYGQTEISFEWLVNDALKNAYVSVDPKQGVQFKSPASVTDDQARQIVKQRGAWILKKLEQVKQTAQSEIVTGSRIPYLGKQFYATVEAVRQPQSVKITFTGAKFQVSVKEGLEDRQTAILEGLNKFYLENAKTKIQPRIERLSKELGLFPEGVIYKRMKTRWASCTKARRLVINSELIKLGYDLIDYVLVHELVHLIHRDHNKHFWGKVEDVMPGYRALHERIEWMSL